MELVNKERTETVYTVKLTEKEIKVILASMLYSSTSSTFSALGDPDFMEKFHTENYTEDDSELAQEAFNTFCNILGVNPE